MRKYVKLYKEAILISFSAASTYRVNFLLQSIITLLSNVVFPLVTLLIYQSGASFQGWSLYEVLLIQSVFTMATGISNMMFSGIVWNTMYHVKEGTLEIILIKPVDCLFYLLASNFNLDGIGVVTGGLVIFIVSLFHIAMPNLFVWLQFIILFLLGILVMLGVNLLMAATSFRWVANSRIPEMYNSVLQFGNYPQSIFPKVVTAITAFLLPVAMVGFFPASVLLGRSERWMYLTILPCFLIVMVGIKLYQHMVRLYEGVGG